MKVSIIIPLYRITPLFYQCMESLRLYSPECEVIVIRADGSFAENCNRGIAASNSDYICLLNDDCVVTENWLGPLVKLLDENPKAGAVSPMMLFPDGHVQFGGMVFHKDYSGGHLGWGWKGDDPRLLKEPTQFQATTFGCVLLRRTALGADETKKYLDESFKIGGYEDIDCCLKMKLVGWEIWYQPESKIWHYESQTFRLISPNTMDKASMDNREIYMNRWKKYFDDGTFKLDDIDFEGGVCYCKCGHESISHPRMFCKECECNRFDV